VENVDIIVEMALLFVSKMLQPQSVLKDVECIEKRSGTISGKILSDHLLFARDHQGQLRLLYLCVFLYRGVDFSILHCRLRKNGVGWPPFIASDHPIVLDLLLLVFQYGVSNNLHWLVHV
jgi:hypothetical protein